MKHKRPYEAYVDILYTYRFIIESASSPEDAESQAERLVENGEPGELDSSEVLSVAAQVLNEEVVEQMSFPFMHEDEPPVDMRTTEELDEDEEEETDYFGE